MTWGWNEHRIRVSTESNSGEENSPAASSCRESNPRPPDHEPVALTAELYRPPWGVVRSGPTAVKDWGSKTDDTILSYRCILSYCWNDDDIIDDFKARMSKIREKHGIFCLGIHSLGGHLKQNNLYFCLGYLQLILLQDWWKLRWSNAVLYQTMTYIFGGGGWGTRGIFFVVVYVKVLLLSLIRRANEQTLHFYPSLCPLVIELFLLSSV